MKFYRHIEAAINHLERLGIEYEIDIGRVRQISDAKITAFEDKLGEPLPMEYKAYLKELGDGFQFRYTTPIQFLEEMAERVPLDPESSIGRTRSAQLREQHDNGWSLDYFYDTVMEWDGRGDDLAESEIIRYLNTDGEEYVNECRRRRRWFSIMGIGCGGYTLNYDYGTNIGAIRYHDIRMPGYQASAHVANSLDDWMEKWSRYAFSNPISPETGIQWHSFDSYCYGISGEFPWDDEHFLPAFRIPR